MYCNKCGKQVDSNQKFCNNCGNQLSSQIPINNTQPVVNTQIQSNNTQSVVNNQTPYTNNQSTNYKQPINFNQPINYNQSTPINTPQSIPNNKVEKNNPVQKAAIGFSLGMLILLVIYAFNKFKPVDIHIPPSETGSPPTVVKNTNGETSIVHDNKYEISGVKSVSEAQKLISKDSTDQKVNCPNQIISIEDKLIKNFDITAVNFCEMDSNYSSQIEDVVKKIYKDFPSVRGYLTNMTIINLPKDATSSRIIAQFMPIFVFAESKTNTTLPWIIKTQLQLNSRYFLNLKLLETAVRESTNSKHFPPNSNIYSPIAHELGHYISFIAMIKYYKLDNIIIYDFHNSNTINEVYSDFAEGDFSLSLLKEAHANYEKAKGKMDFDEWRASISGYAVAKDNNGKYIYDETIAEAFHDVFVNGDKANEASKYIYKLLQERLKR